MSYVPYALTRPRPYRHPHVTAYVVGDVGENPYMRGECRVSTPM